MAARNDHGEAATAQYKAGGTLVPIPIGHGIVGKFYGREMVIHVCADACGAELDRARTVNPLRLRLKRVRGLAAKRGGRSADVAYQASRPHNAGMSTEHLIPGDLRELYHVKEWRNATGVLVTACPAEWSEIQEVLREFRLYRSEIVVGGGNRSLVSRRIDEALYRRGWKEKAFATTIEVDEARFPSPTHAVDCLKGGVALEMEWNNKDPFFDRDLNNFRLLFDLRAIQVGIIVTRAWELQALFKQLGKGSSYGKATTHHVKLWPKVEGGGGGGCPVLTFAIKPALFIDDGHEAFRKLKAKMDAEKAASNARKRAAATLGLPATGAEDGDTDTDDEA